MLPENTEAVYLTFKVLHIQLASSLNGDLNAAASLSQHGLSKAVKSDFVKNKMKNIADKYLDQAVDSVSSDLSKKIAPTGGAIKNKIGTLIVNTDSLTINREIIPDFLKCYGSILAEEQFQDLLTALKNSKNAEIKFTLRQLKIYIF